MKTQIKKLSMLTVMFFVFAFARAGFIPVITVHNACHGNDGSIVFSNLQSDGPGPFAVRVNSYSGYSFADSAISASADSFVVSGLSSDTYEVLVQQILSPSTRTWDSLTIGTVVNAYPAVSNASCPANNGSVTIYASGGASPYSYVWANNSATGPYVSNLGGGNYSATVTEAGGCYAVVNSTVASLSNILVNVSPGVGNTCIATLVASATGTTGNVSYSWNNGATTSTIGNLSNGYYYVTVTDANGCQGVASGYAYAPGLHIDSFSRVVPAGCSNNGSIGIQITNGTAPYTFLWSNGATDSVITGLASGNYTVTATDHTGCSAVRTFYVPQTSTLTLDSSVAVFPDCRGNGGKIVTHSLNGIAPYTYLWSTGSTDTMITNVPIGSYSVTVTDAAGCIGVNHYYLDTLRISDYIYVNAYPGCGQPTGSLTLQAHYYTRNPGGVPSAFSYVWSNGASTATVNNLVAANYQVTVNDAINGCSATNAYNLQNTGGVYAYISNIQNPTCGGSDGSLSSFGYYGSGTYTYQWSNGATTADITNLPAGTYTVTVTDLTGCSSTAGYTLIGYSNMYVNIITTPTACDTSLHTGTATAIVTGNGAATPYHYMWYDGFYNTQTSAVLDTNQTVTGLHYGQYVSVRVYDNNGCGSNYSVYDSAQIAFDPACYDHIIGNVFIDNNTNCTIDAGDQGMANAYVYANSSSGSFYANTDSNGFYDIAVIPGAYTVTVYFYGYGLCAVPTCTSVYLDTFTTNGQVSSGNNFSVSSSAAADLGVHPGCTSSTPGSPKEYWIYYYNQGPVAVSNAVVSFTYDPSLTLTSTSPAYTSLNTATHTITWNVGTVPAVYSWNRLVMYFDVPSTVTLGTVLYAQAEIDPIAGDCNPGDNIVNISDVVAASHDPNEKLVVPAGNLSASDTVLTYTIRFQNTGNAPASRVVITDQLSANVNPVTVNPGASSAPYKFTLSGNGLMTFTFDGINLPDSSHGDSSKGFVTYTVHTRPDLPIGTQIDNTAYIYFDINPAIVTNTTVNTRSDWPNGIPTISGGAMSAQVVPNPANDKAIITFKGATGNVELTLTDELGNLLLSTTTDSKNYTLDAQRFAPGMYFYAAKDANGNRASGKISIVK